MKYTLIIFIFSIIMIPSQTWGLEKLTFTEFQGVTTIVSDGDTTYVGIDTETGDVKYSHDEGETWNDIIATDPDGLPLNISKIIYADGIFLATGRTEGISQPSLNVGTLWTSPDGVNWERKQRGTGPWDFLLYENGTFYAFGRSVCDTIFVCFPSPIVLSSVDGGDTWSSLSLSGVSQDDSFRRVVYYNNNFYAVTGPFIGAGSSFLVSSDAKAWSSSFLLDSIFGNVSAISSTNELLFVKGEGGTFISSDGLNWDGPYDYPNWFHLIFFDNSYLSIGQDGIYQSKDNGNSWEESYSLAIPANSYFITQDKEIFLSSFNWVKARFGPWLFLSSSLFGEYQEETPSEEPSTPKPQQSIIGIRYCTDSITSFCKPRTTPPPTVENPFGGTTCSAELLITNNMKQGDRNGHYSSYNQGTITQVHILQSHINRLLGTDYSQAAGPVDGIFGPLSTQGVKRLQTKLNQLLPNMTPLVIDGIVGPFTKTAVNQSC